MPNYKLPSLSFLFYGIVLMSYVSSITIESETNKGRANIKSIYIIIKFLRAYFYNTEVNQTTNFHHIAHI